MTVVQLQQQSHLLSGSDKRVSTNLDGWDTEGYDDNGGDQIDVFVPFGVFRCFKPKIFILYPINSKHYFVTLQPKWKTAIRL